MFLYIYIKLVFIINFIINFSFAEEFCTNVPKNPIRILHETKLQPSFRFVLLNLILNLISYVSMI